MSDIIKIVLYSKRYFEKVDRLALLNCRWCKKETAHIEGSWNRSSGLLGLECSECHGFKVFKSVGNEEFEVVSDNGRSAFHQHVE